ncbi:ras-domain-containing protein [Neolentinus lepideus HHB14362 ss-1]|uniref:Ras-domain-containing protein n=1 Tax=Neolentinus lepideus HHB14362 ss-1 TaxID=1314782 RepID=A0A165RUR3_9AGAM|nr:ras-domain-containing protein [Neolentinus lepideus HHB14362 ss-1]
MRTVKVVIIGESGVGKTSLRGQYISGRFSNGYRATIGADFISKTVPHHNHPDENVTLQIWDTAGQERFSSLSSAFFRGADAAILVFDVNHPQTLEALRKWWEDFKEKAPVRDDEVDDYCCVVVGNKVDLVGTSNGDGKVSELDALRFMDEIIPPGPELSSLTEVREDMHTLSINGNGNGYPESISRNRTNSIDITGPSHSLLAKSRSRSRSSKYLAGTVTTTHTTLSIYHTPSSSLFDMYESARSSPVPGTLPRRSISISPEGRSKSSTHSRNHSRNSSLGPRRMSNLSLSTTSSAPTITPSLFAAQQHWHNHAHGHNFHPHPSPERRPKLFFTSAKTGEGVSDVFEYVAARVVRRWEYEDAAESRVMHMQEPSSIRLDDESTEGLKGRLRCC